MAHGGGRTSDRPISEATFEQSIAALQNRLSVCRDLGELLDALEIGLGPLLPVRDRVSVAFLEPDGEWMRIYRVLPRFAGREAELPRVRVEGTPVGRVVREGVGRVVADTRANPNITFGHASRDGIRSTLSVPLRIGGRVVGAMNAGSSSVSACSEEMLRPLADIAAIVGPAILAAEQVFRDTEAQAGPAPSSAAPASAATTGERDGTYGLVGRSEAFRSLLTDARRAARSDADVLITGETGAGKTAVARAIHAWSARSAGPFVTVHLADLTPTLIESELFGHERGSFTGASSERVGRFESAQGGTIFLDEVGEAPLPVQSKLLRVVQDRCFERVGGGRVVEIDVRIIAATSRDLREAVRLGEFRKDFFYRLNVVPLRVPPLRERTEDLGPLVESILARVNAAADRNRRLAADAWRRLRSHSWPGNIRELESVLRRATILEEDDELLLNGFPDPADGAPEAAAEAEEPWPTLEEHQRRYILRVLELRSAVIEGPGGAAELLGMAPSTLRSRMKKLGISSRAIRAGVRRS
jgi:formate hydrogenlyase transcriptional activator